MHRIHHLHPKMPTRSSKANNQYQIQTRGRYPNRPCSPNGGLPFPFLLAAAELQLHRQAAHLVLRVFTRVATTNNQFSPFSTTTSRPLPLFPHISMQHLPGSNLISLGKRRRFPLALLNVHLYTPILILTPFPIHPNRGLRTGSRVSRYRPCNKIVNIICLCHQ